MALAVNQITRDKGKAFIVVVGARSSDLTGKACSPNTVHWTYDTWALANGTGNAVVKTGGDTLVLHHRRLRLRPRARARRRGGGAARTAARCWARCGTRSTPRTSRRSCCRPRPRRPRSSAWPTPAATPPTPIKQGAEFGIVKGGQNFAGLLVFLTDVHALGLEKAQGLIFTETFYWDMNDKTRAFAKRFAERNRGIHPTMIHAGVVRGHAALPRRRSRRSRATTATKVIAKMKEMPTDDPLFGKGDDPRRRPQDPSGIPRRGQEAGRVQGPVGLLQDPRDDPGRAGASGRSTEGDCPLGEEIARTDRAARERLVPIARHPDRRRCSVSSSSG